MFTNRFVPLGLAAVLCAVFAVPAHAQPSAAQHTLELTPSVVHAGVEDFKSDSWPFGSDDPGCGGSGAQVGYTHLVDVNVRDTYRNCVWQAALRFDLSPLQRHFGAVITDATLTYAESFNALLLPDGHPAANPFDLNEDAVWGSCVSRLTVPTADWRNDIGLTPNADDDTIERLDGTTWVVTNQVSHGISSRTSRTSGCCFSAMTKVTSSAITPAV